MECLVPCPEPTEALRHHLGLADKPRPPRAWHPPVYPKTAPATPPRSAPAQWPAASGAMAARTRGADLAPTPPKPRAVYTQVQTRSGGGTDRNLDVSLAARRRGDGRSPDRKVTACEPNRDCRVFLGNRKPINCIVEGARP